MSRDVDKKILYTSVIKKLISNLLIENKNYDGYYFRSSGVSDLIKDTKERATYILEEVENLKHLIE